MITPISLTGASDFAMLNRAAVDCSATGESNHSSTAQSGHPQANAGGWWSSFTKIKSFWSSPAVDVIDCLKRYCAVELLTGREKVLCERCKIRQDCAKQLMLYELPEVLCLHLKRFRYEAGWFGQKNSRQVTFPVRSTLDVSSVIDPQAPAFQHPVNDNPISMSYRQRTESSTSLSPSSASTRTLTPYLSSSSNPGTATEGFPANGSSTANPRNSGTSFPRNVGASWRHSTEYR